MLYADIFIILFTYIILTLLSAAGPVGFILCETFTEAAHVLVAVEASKRFKVALNFVFTALSLRGVKSGWKNNGGFFVFFCFFILIFY